MELVAENLLAYGELSGIGPIQTIYAVCTADTLLELHGRCVEFTTVNMWSASVEESGKLNGLLGYIF
jgi:hypothetical protein